jgi:hypothetical protein
MFAKSLPLGVVARRQRLLRFIIRRWSSWRGHHLSVAVRLDERSTGIRTSSFVGLDNCTGYATSGSSAVVRVLLHVLAVVAPLILHPRRAHLPPAVSIPRSIAEFHHADDGHASGWLVWTMMFHPQQGVRTTCVD